MMKPFSTKGSIMIWTLLMGISLAVVFFFFSLRLNSSAASQRETMVYLNARLLVDSYAAYLEQLPLADLQTIKGAGPIAFNGITGSLTNDATEITGVVDAGVSSPQFRFSDTVKVEWNLCSLNYKADLVLVQATDTSYPHVSPPPPSCTSSTAGYDDEATVAVTDPFSLKSNGVPFYYRITSTTPDKSVPGDEWQLNLEIPLSFRKKVSVSRTFTPSS